MSAYHVFETGNKTLALLQAEVRTVVQHYEIHRNDKRVAAALSSDTLSVCLGNIDGGRLRCVIGHRGSYVLIEAVTKPRDR